MAEVEAVDPEALVDYTLAQDVNVKGVPHKSGEKVSLTGEEHEALVAAGVKFEGDEAPTDEELQSKHDEGVEAQKAEIERRQAEEEEEDEETTPA